MKGGVKSVLKIIKSDYECFLHVSECVDCPLSESNKGFIGYGNTILWGCGCQAMSEAERKVYIKGKVLQYLVKEVGKDKFKELLVEELI